MDTTSMPFDPEVAEVALVWVHLPTGASAVQGVVRHPDGGPILAGSRMGARPVGAGGTEVLSPGVPAGHGVLTPDPATWAQTGTDTAEQAAEERGWHLLTRAQAVDVLAAQGYRLRSRLQPGHVLHSDQADESVWHDRQSISGRPAAYVRAAFVARPIRLPDSPEGVHASPVGTHDTDYRARG